ncbi:MAG: zf-HC2 domain-containing protein [Bacteroidaceae bacterium]|nr:zf-HC2 domain-containing protein [Bacteroidaceae bacterium]
MNCKEFKEKVADLFDTTIDMHTQAECKAHMAECPECKAYYEELLEAFNALQPQEASATPSVSTPARKQHHLWRPIAAAAVFLLGFFIGWSHLFSTSAVAEAPRGQLFEQGIKSVQNVGSFQMAVYARTTPNDNFAYFAPKADFVRIDIGLLRQNDSVFYRVEKQNGRAIVFDGQTQYMWIPGALYVKGPCAANFLEHFVNLLSPERLLAMQKSAIDFSKKNEVVRTESDSTITLTFKGTEKNSDLQQLLETGKMGDCEVEVENVFTKNDGLLRFVKLRVVNHGQKTLLLHIDNIQYNVMMSRASLIQIPDTQWTDAAETTSRTADDRLGMLQNETATQAAQRILQAIISADSSQASEALVYCERMFPALSEKMKGCRVSDFKERRDGDYIGTYVFYTLTHPDGRQEQKHIAVRNDNERHIWIADGGL